MSQLEGPNVVIICDDLKVRNDLINQLNVLREQFDNLKISGLEPNMASSDLEKIAQVVIIDVKYWSHADEMMVAGLRGTGFKGPMLILAQKEAQSGDVGTGVNNREFPKGGIFEKIVFLNKPFDPKEMLGVVRRMVLAPIIAARKHTRHDTNEVAELQISGRKSSFSCRVKNMSKGGAYLEFFRSIEIKVGDSVLFKVRLGQIKREYRLRARVAWLNMSTGVGIEFSTSSENADSSKVKTKIQK